MKQPTASPGTHQKIACRCTATEQGQRASPGCTQEGRSLTVLALSTVSRAVSCAIAVWFVNRLLVIGVQVNGLGGGRQGEETEGLAHARRCGAVRSPGTRSTPELLF